MGSPRNGCGLHFGADAFLHHTEFEALVLSSSSCALCRLVTETFGGVAHYTRDDAQLGLFPWSSKAIRFSASFGTQLVEQSIVRD
jgi:hypothetical protein